jgi:glycosyltransferase involved in cell wall biosynthesis
VDVILFKPIHLPSAPKDEFRILFVGRLAVQKNLFNLIKAVDSLQNPKIRLIMIGRGSEKNKLKEYAADRNVNLEIIDHVANDKLPEYYNQTNLFVLPSIKEGSPKVLLEAMACGSLCLVSDIVENTEVVVDGKNGFVCKTNDESIAEKMSMMIKADNIPLIKQASRQTIVDKYSFELLMKKEVQYLKKIAKNL